MVFNPLEQERLSVVSLLVSSPRVRVFSEEGQPLAVQISVHWSSATDVVPDVYQVRGALHVGSGPGPLLTLGLSPPTPAPHPLVCGPAYSRVGAGVLGRGIAQRIVTRRT